MLFRSGDGDGQWRLRLQGRELALQAPGLESLPQPLRAAVDGEVGLTRSAAGWSLSTQDLALRFATGPALRIGGSAAVGAAGAAGANGAMTSRLTLDLAEPLPRTAMTLPQAAKSLLSEDGMAGDTTSFAELFQGGLPIAGADKLAPAGAAREELTAAKKDATKRPKVRIPGTV